MTGYESKRAAARDKLAQPEQEPVAKPYRVKKRFTISLMEKLIKAKLKERNHG